MQYIQGLAAGKVKPKMVRESREERHVADGVEGAKDLILILQSSKLLSYFLSLIGA